ncbi:ion transporter [Vibrio sp. WJH972]
MNQLSNDEFGPFQFLILMLSIYVLISLSIQAIYVLPTDIEQILRTGDNFICAFFFADFLIRFYKAENKIAYMKWGWIDLLSSIPIVDAFQYGRLVSVIRILKILRAVRSAKVILSFLFRKKVRGATAVVTFLSIVLAIFCSIAILQVEKGAEGANIQNASNAIWWVFVTITTVGYGDFFPVTLEGRILAALLMTCGVGLFGTFTGFIAMWFFEEESEDPTNETMTALETEVHDLKNEIIELKALIKQSK